MIQVSILTKQGNQFSVQWDLTPDQAEALLREPFVIIRGPERRTAVATSSIDLFDVVSVPESSDGVGD